MNGRGSLTLLQQPRLRGLSARARSRVTLRQMLVQFSELVFCSIGISNLRRPFYLRPSPRSLLYE